MYPLAAVTAVIMVLLIIRPCSRCHTTPDQNRRLSATQWIERGIRSTDLNKNAILEKNKMKSQVRRITAPASEKTKAASIKSAKEKKIIDFGIKLELIPPPKTR
jgi:hypothetical protein